MNDPRVTATARAIQYQRAEEGPEIINFSRWLAEVALTAADAADREQGIHRVRVDDATVERVAHVVELADAEWEGSSVDWPTRIARAVLTALTGAES